MTNPFTLSYHLGGAALQTFLFYLGSSKGDAILLINEIQHALFFKNSFIYFGPCWVSVALVGFSLGWLRLL